MANELRIKMCGIPVSDPVKAFEFYTKVLGYKELQFMPEHRIAIVVSAIDPDGVALMLEPNENPISSTFQKALYEAGIPVMTMGVKDVAKCYSDLSAKGVKFKSEPVTNDWGTMVSFEDGFGNYVQMHQDD